MKEYARSFYQSKAWRDISRLYMTSKNYVCERCGGVGVICHHKKYITPANIGDLSITLNMDNLECLCRECHNREHSLKRSRVLFDDQGNIAAIQESRDAKEYREALEAIDRIKTTAQNARGGGFTGQW